MKWIITYLFVPLTLAQFSQPGLDLSECGTSKKCLGSTAVDDDLLRADNPCLENDVSKYLHVFLKITRNLLT